MKNIALIIAVVALSIGACKIGKHADKKTTATTTTTMEQTTGQTKGTVSHQYRATGCATVIIVKKGDEVMTLIPKDKLPDNLDVDGMVISFDYVPLRMHNPEGCNAGFPAQLSNVKASK
jgi:hypothetical protein